MNVNKAIAALAVIGLNLTTNPLQAMEPEQGLASFLNETNRASAQFLQTLIPQIPQSENKEPCYLEMVPDDIKIVIMRNLDLEELVILSHTAKSFRTSLTSTSIYKSVVKPEADFLINRFGGFRYRSLEVMATSSINRKYSPTPDSVINENGQPCPGYYVVKQLAAAGSLGCGDAYLLFAELDWRSSIFNGKHFMRPQIYQRALTSKIPGTNTLRFDVQSDEYNAVLIGIAEHFLTNYNPVNLELERKHVISAVSALTAITDSLFWKNAQLGGGAEYVPNKLTSILWRGDYSPYSKDQNTARSNEMKAADFELLFNLAQHTLALGLTLEDNLSNDHMYTGIPLAALKNTTQKELFIKKHLHLMPR